MTHSAASVLFQLLSRGITLSVAGDRLRVMPASRLDAELRRGVSQSKPELIDWLREAVAPAGVPSFWSQCAAAALSGVEDRETRSDLRERFEERAAIVEYEGRQSRDDAERLAFRELYGAVTTAAELIGSTRTVGLPS